jgi:prepilin-type N-terminal cleavage/methylation domain-containing protein
MKRLTKPSGFTLIEIVLVLSLAGLIMMIAFIALSGAQKARRDDERKHQLSIMAAKLLEYQGNNGGRHPTDQAELDQFSANYFHGYKDPQTGQDYQLIYSNSAEATHNTFPAQGEILYGREHFCETSNSTILDDTNAHFYSDHFMLVYLEQGKYYCIDNHAR